MAIRSKDARQCWISTQSLLDHWLGERQATLVQYCDLVGVSAFTPSDAHFPLALKRFCDLLVDYLSQGHFEVFETLIHEEQLFGGGQAKLLADVYPQLLANTQVLLDCCDRFEAFEFEDSESKKIQQLLSVIGEQFAERLELEDQLVDVFHHSHRHEIAA